ncbi:MAG TPA: Gfo/Idh/MocA family oxidoreductase [Thermoguttaceae bacterium]|nr:Gfo/Idh/MocA family oxidoreductase [Thermoguttaceae bacterium]
MKLRLAVVGAGRLGGFHARKIADRDDAELTAVVDPSPESRNRVAAECRTQALPDCGPLPGRIDAAVIAAPTRLHHRLALDLLKSGIHLLVEKPICSTRAEADELVETARRHRLVLQVGHVERFNPAFAAATAQVENPKYIEAVRAGPFTFRSTDVGVVLDLMIHDIDLVLSMVRSRVRKVDALGLSVLGGHEDVANARLQFENGCVATLSASRVSYEPVRRMHVWSLRSFAGIDFATRAVNVVRPSETLLRRQFDVDALSPEQVEHYLGHLSEEHLPCQRVEFEAVDALALQLQDFFEAIRTARRPRVTGEAGRDALAVAEQILARIHTHAWDDLSEGPVGPLAVGRPRVIPAPHFEFSPEIFPAARQEAG